MLKKFFMTILFAIFILASLYTNICYAAPVKVTKENLSEAFEKFVSSESNEENYEISVSDKVINIKADKEKYTLNYDLKDNPKFSAELLIKEGMSYDEFEKEAAKIILPMLGYISVANVQGVKIEDSSMYFMFSYLEKALNESDLEEDIYIIIDDLDDTQDIVGEENDAKIIYTSEFGNKVMEYADYLYSEKQTLSDSDEMNSYVWTIEKTDSTKTSCKVLSTLTVNLDADFSKLNGYSEKKADEMLGEMTDEILDEVTDKKDEEVSDNKTDKVTDDIADKVDDDVVDTEKNDTDKPNKEIVEEKEEIKDTADLDILPKTGEEKNANLIALYTIIGISSISLITLLGISKKKK